VVITRLWNALQIIKGVTDVAGITAALSMMQMAMAAAHLQEALVAVIMGPMARVVVLTTELSLVMVVMVRNAGCVVWRADGIAGITVALLTMQMAMAAAHLCTVVSTLGICSPELVVLSRILPMVLFGNQGCRTIGILGQGALRRD